MKLPPFYNDQQILHFLVMGNNLKAIQTAKALTNKISSKEPYVPTNGCQDFEISRRSSSKSSLLPTSAGVTVKPAGRRSEPSGKDLVKNHVMQNRSPMMNHNGTDSFVYYIPEENGNHSQDESMLDRINASQHTSETRRMESMQAERSCDISMQGTGKQFTCKPIVVDLTLDDSDDEQEDLSTSQPVNTFPKILAAYSLTENTPFPDLSNLLTRKPKENQSKKNDIVVDSLVLNTKVNGSFTESPSNKSRPIEPVRQSTLISPNQLSLDKPTVSQHDKVRTKPRGLVFDNTTNILESPSYDARTCFEKNGLRTSTNDITRVLTGHVPSVRNDVMQDVTNTHNLHSYEYRPLFLSRPPVTTSTDGDDNVVITKVITPTETKGRQKHRRKAPIEVRQWCFEEQNNQITNVAHNKRTQLNSNKHSLNSLQDNSTKNSQRTSPNNIHREAKIRTLKNLLAKQEKVVEKIKTIDNTSSSLVPTDRILVVEIPDLKSELHIPSAGKHSFRVCSQTISISPKDDNSARKRPRKSDPRKIAQQEHRYPSYVEAPDDDLVASKRFKGKQKVGRKSRGRNSPKLINQIPVVSKDLWHRELEKVEEKLALSGQPINQSAFMLFLGLRKV